MFPHELTETKTATANKKKLLRVFKSFFPWTKCIIYTVLALQKSIKIITSSKNNQISKRKKKNPPSLHSQSGRGEGCHSGPTGRVCPDRQLAHGPRRTWRGGPRRPTRVVSHVRSVRAHHAHLPPDLIRRGRVQPPAVRSRSYGSTRAAQVDRGARPAWSFRFRR